MWKGHSLVYDTAPEAVRVRRWDDAGKTLNVDTPSFAAFRPLLRRVLVDERSTSAQPAA